MHRTGGLDVERKPRPPNPFCALDLVAAAIARDFELRQRRSLRRRKRNFEIPSGRGRIEAGGPGVTGVGQRRHLQQGLARDRSIGVFEQMMRCYGQRCIGWDRRRRDHLRGRQAPSKWRRRRIGADSRHLAASIWQRHRYRRRVACGLGSLLQRFLQQIEHRTCRHRTWPARQQRLSQYDVSRSAGILRLICEWQPRLRQ